MKKKVLVISLAVIMCLAVFVGCSPAGSGTESAGASTAPSAGVSEAAPESAEASAAESAASFVPGDQIEAPAGKSLAVLPVDQVADETIKIATVGMNTNAFDLFVCEGIEFAGNILKDRNVQCDFISIKEHNLTEYEAAIRNCLSAGYDAITCNGFGAQLQPIIAEAAKEGVPFFIFNNPAGDNPEDSEALSFWGQSGFDGGAALGKMACEEIGGKGKYAIITGSFALSGHEQRRLGFRSVADTYSDMTLVGEYENKDLYETAYEIATNLITANPDLACIYVTAGGPGGAAKAIEDAGKAGQIVMVCHDWMPDTVPFIRSGVISGVLDQDPFTQGYAPIIDAFNYLVGGVTPEKVNMIEGQIATPENVAELIPEE